MSDTRFMRFGPTIDAKLHDLVPVNKNIYEVIRNKPTVDYYTSLYTYGPHHVEHFKNTHSVAGIRDVKTHRLVFDLDSKTNPEQTRTDALTVCERLMENGVPEDKIRVYFSGGKGFHVEVTSKQELTRPEFENIVFGLASDLPTFDTKIKDEARIIRAPLTRHPQSGLFKTPLTIDELKSNSMESIRKLASDVSDINPESLSDDNFEIDLPKNLIELKAKAVEKKTPLVSETDLSFDVRDIDFSKCPKWMPKERYALQEGFFYGSESVDTGERNTAFMILAATYRNQGFSADHTLQLLVATAEKQAARTGEEVKSEEELRKTVIATVFSPNWGGGIYGKDEELLIKTRERFSIADSTIANKLIQIGDVGDGFKSFAHNIDQNTIKTGIKSIDDNVLITTGMLIGLLGAPSSGKSSWANIFAEHLSSQKIPVIYHSLDMYTNLLFIRLLQRYSGYDMRKILDMFKTDTPDKTLMDAYSQVLKKYSDVSFNFRSGPTVEEIEQDVVDYKQNTGRQPKLLIVDYLEKVRGPFSDPTANSGYVASRLSDVAKTHDMAVLLLLQPQKAAGDPREELLSMRKVKGASVIEQDCRVILTVWRPGFNPKAMDDDKFTSIAVVKNNMGGLCQLDFGWNGVTGSLTELDHRGRGELKELRDRIAEEKAAQKDDF